LLTTKHKQFVNEQNLIKVAEELEQESCNEILNEYNTEIAYDKTDKHWLTSSPINACKKTSL
jgi:hypothetical protein